MLHRNDPIASFSRLLPFGQRSWRDAEHSVVIHSRIDSPPSGRPRKDFEKLICPAVEVGLAGWHRAHSQGRITGPESAQGILYAPPEVNLQLQRAGIERFIRQLIEMADSDVELYLTTVTSAHPWTLRLKEIQYAVSCWRQNRTRTLFEASIQVRNSRDRPMSWAEVKEIVSSDQWPVLIA